MEQSNIKEFERINRIANSKIPVSEESSVFNLFAERKKLVGRICRDMLTEEDRKLLLEQLNYVEDRIKEYLCL